MGTSAHVGRRRSGWGTMVQRREEPVLCSPYENRREGGKMDSRGVEGVRWTSESRRRVSGFR